MDSNETTFKAYGSETVPTDGGESQNMFGCDGTHHAVWKTLFETGHEVPTDNTVEDLGICDGRCADGFALYKGGGFLHTVPKPRLMSS
jgi:hypothetical protein